MPDYVTRHRDIEISISDEFAMLQARVAECVEVVVDAFAVAGGLKNIRNGRLSICKSTDSWPRALQELDDGLPAPADNGQCALIVYYLGHELGHVVSGFEAKSSKSSMRDCLTTHP